MPRVNNKLNNLLFVVGLFVVCSGCLSNDNSRHFQHKVLNKILLEENNLRGIFGGLCISEWRETACIRSNLFLPKRSVARMWGLTADNDLVK